MGIILKQNTSRQTALMETQPPQKDKHVFPIHICDTLLLITVAASNLAFIFLPRSVKVLTTKLHIVFTIFRFCLSMLLFTSVDRMSSFKMTMHFYVT